MQLTSTKELQYKVRLGGKSKPQEIVEEIKILPN